MFLTVWLSLALFALAELGKQNTRAWAWPASAAGVILMAVHIVLAMAIAHGWSQTAAVDATARQTMAVMGIAWGGGVYVNYLFVGAWIAELVVWRARGRPVRSRLLQAFYLIIIFNAAVVFAAGWRRILGVVLVAALFAAWRPAAARRRSVSTPV